ncbi:MAG: DUF1778 domain-containing protein [Gammaproteobacteria bacterium]
MKCRPVSNSVVRRPHEVVVQAERISLSDRDAKRVLDALENPPKPTTPESGPRVR